jgi:hypothetical protein
MTSCYENERRLTVERDVTRVPDAQSGELSLEAIHACQHGAGVLSDDGAPRHAVSPALSQQQASA